MTADPNPADVFVEHRTDLVRYASRIVGSDSVAEDVVQEAYLRFARQSAGASDGTLGRVPGDAAQDRILEPVRYLYRIVRNLAFDWGRRPSLPLAADIDDTLMARVASNEPTPEDTAIWRRELGRVESALDALPDRTRLAFEMHRLAGMPLKDIAAELDISVTRTHQLIKTALTACADQLDPDPPGDDATGG